jgi:hypothetical protein
MPSPAERHALNFAGRGFVAVIVVLVAIPAYLTLAPSWRPIAARLACALVVAAVCARLIRSVRGAADEHAPSALDLPSPPPRTPSVDERFVRLRDELTFSVRSRRYFDTILWPQLVHLGAADADRPREGRRRRRPGPSLGDLERIIDTVERRP